MTAIPMFPHLPEKVVRLADVEPIRWGGEEAARRLLRGDDTGGLYSYYEVSVPAGEGSIFHVHEDMDETFFVVEGEFEVKIGDTFHAAPEGVLVYGPRGRALLPQHLGQAEQDALRHRPGGIEDFFTELSALMSEPTRPDWERMSELAAKHRIIAHRRWADRTADRRAADTEYQRTEAGDSMTNHSLPGTNAAKYGPGDRLIAMQAAHDAFRRDLERMARVATPANLRDPGGASPS